MPSPAPTVLTSGALSAANVLTTTGSVSPATTEACQLVWIWAQKSTGGLTDTATVVGNSRTWAKVQSGVSGNFVWSLWIGYSTATSGTIAITHNAIPTSGRYVVMQQTQVDPSVNPINNSWTNTGTGTTGTVTPTACANMLHSYWGHNATETTTPDSTIATWVEVHDGGAAAMNIEVQHIFGGDGSATATWATSSLWAGAVVEFKKYTLAVTGIDEEPSDSTSGNAVLFDGGDDGSWSIVGGS